MAGVFFVDHSNRNYTQSQQMAMENTIPYRMVINTEINLVNWLRSVKFTELNISESLFLNLIKN